MREGANGMAIEKDGEVLHTVGSLFEIGTAGNLGDEQLLDRFVTRSDSHAFEALVLRHGPMVLGVCRGLLRDPHAAEDAFQATFLVLARRARSIRKQESLGNWLFGVARR